MERLTLVSLLFMSLGGCSDQVEVAQAPATPASFEAKDSADTDGVGCIEVFSSPARAFVYIDGQFMGETSSDAPLVVTRKAGDVQLRVTCPHWHDGVWQLAIPKGEILTVKAHLDVSTARWHRPAQDVVIGPGQELRGELVAIAGKVKALRYAETIAAPVERIICVVKGRPDVRVIDSSGQPVQLELMPERIEGAPGNRFLRVKLAVSGRYFLEVSGRPGAYSLRWMNGVPPLSGSSVPHLKRRRKAPESFGPK